MKRLSDPGMQLRSAVPTAAPPPAAADTAVHEAQPAATVLSPEEVEEEEARRKAFITGGDLILSIRLDEELDLMFNPSLRVRVQPDEKFVSKYRERFERQIAEGLDPAEQCPALVAYILVPPGVDAKAYRGRLRPAQVVAGEHRILAGRAAGVQRLRCVIKVGTWHEAYEYAVQDNQAHGKDLTDEDRLHMVLPFLKDPHWGNLSTREIRVRTGVPRDKIEALRKSVNVPLDTVCTPQGSASGQLTESVDEPAKPAPDTVCTPQGSASGQLTEPVDEPAKPAPERRRGKDNKLRTLPQKRGETIRENSALKGIEARLEKLLGTEVKMRPKSWKRGEVVIPYKSLDEVDALIKRFETPTPAGKRK